MRNMTKRSDVAGVDDEHAADGPFSELAGVELPRSTPGLYGKHLYYPALENPAQKNISLSVHTPVFDTFRRDYNTLGNEIAPPDRAHPFEEPNGQGEEDGGHRPMCRTWGACWRRTSRADWRR